MDFTKFYENSINLDILEAVEELKKDKLLLNETLSDMNMFYRLIGSQKRKVYPKIYDNYVIGSKSYGTLLNKFAGDAVAAKEQKKFKGKKIWITNVFQGVFPNINQMKAFSFKQPDGTQLKFWEPLKKINSVSLYLTNTTPFGLTKTAQGDIVLWDVETIDTFEQLENKEELKKAGWVEGQTQYVLSVSGRAIKLWNQLTGMIIPAYVKAAKLGTIGDPYMGLKDDLAELQKASKTKEEGTPDTQVMAGGEKEYNDILTALGVTTKKESYEYVNEAKKVKIKIVAFDKKENKWKSDLDVFYTTDEIINATAKGKTFVAIDNIKANFDKAIADKKAAGEKAAKEKGEKTAAMDKYKKLNTSIKTREELKAGASPNIETGWTFTLNDGGKIWAYKTKTGEFKLAYDEKGMVALRAAQIKVTSSKEVAAEKELTSKLK